MAFDPAFLDELRARTPIAAVIGRKTKLARSGRQYKACCPFHGEKTPSFYVYDDHFHCFGCGAHGDAISFVMQAEGRSFLEAIEGLASEAGLEVPRQAPADRGRAERAKTLTDVLDAAQRSFVRRLQAPEGREALAYLRGRGLLDATVADHGLGWSGEGRGALLAELREQGFAPGLVAEAGLLRLDEEGRPKGELFFNRVTFPIRDRRGHLVSFGGRTLGDGQPKYLNGPETPLFAKRRTLFGLERAASSMRTVRPAAEAAAGSRELVVVEGYMDVIALHQAGFAGAVAPLGTALTPEQLEALWRVAPAPILCFDGDAAGRRAGIRAAETALPLLDPERTLRLVRLPEGEDPDSLVRTRGARALAAHLGAAAPLSDVLFELLSEGFGDTGPNQRALLHARLVEAAATIRHKVLASAYRQALLDRFFARGRSSRGEPGARTLAPPALRPSLEIETARPERMRLLLAILLRHPQLLPDVEAALCQIELPADLARVRGAVLEAVHDRAADGAALDSAGVIAHLHAAGMAAQADMILASSPLPMADVASLEAMPADAERGWWHFFGFLNMRALAEELQAAQAALARDMNPDTQRKAIMLRQIQLDLQSGEQADEQG